MLYRLFVWWIRGIASLDVASLCCVYKYHPVSVSHLKSPSLSSPHGGRGHCIGIPLVSGEQQEIHGLISCLTVTEKKKETILLKYSHFINPFFCFCTILLLVYLCWLVLFFLSEV